MKIYNEQLENIMKIAFSGGINWAKFDTKTDEWSERPKGASLSKFATQMLLDGKAIKLISTDEVPDKDSTRDCWELTLKKLEKGTELNKEKRPPYADIENVDVTTVDCIIQYALFGCLAMNRSAGEFVEGVIDWKERL